MSEREMTDEEIVEAIYVYAAEQMKAGASDREIRESLMEKGLDGEAAETVVLNLREMKDKAQRGSAGKNMVIGGIICAIGTAVTVGSYSAAASSPQGGSYTVAYGAIIFGGIQFLSGLVGLLKSS